MGWREAGRLSEVAFTELSLQAIYAFRQGNAVPPAAGTELVRKARRRVAQSKGMISVLLGLLTLGGCALLRISPAQRALFVGYPLPTGLYDAAILTGLLSLDLALLWWTGLQSLPTLMSSQVLEVLQPLPIDPSTLRKVAAIVYLRLFDAPIVTVAVLTPVGVGLALGPWEALAILPGVATAVLIALALSLLTGRFFVRRVQGSGGGGGRWIVRWAYLLLWIVPAFGVLGFVTLAPVFFAELSHLAYGPAVPGEFLLLFVYPFPMAVVPPLLTSGPRSLGLAPFDVLGLLVASVGYAGLGIWSLVWLYRNVGRLGVLPPEQRRASAVVPASISPQRPALAVLTRDLRIASRTPGYAFLILLPLLDSLALGLVSWIGPRGSTTALGVAFGAVGSAALLATFFGPAFFALEVLANSYARTLPLTQRSVVLGKTTLVLAIYLAASGIVLGITAARVAGGLLFPEFVVAALPAVAAAALLELGILYRWGRRRGQPVTNLYAGATNVLLVSLPGLVAVATPLVIFEFVGLGGMAVAGLVELGVFAPFGLGVGSS